MAQTKASEKNWRMILSLAASTLGILFFLIQAVTLGVIWLISFFETPFGMTQDISVGLLVWSSILAGLLLVPVFLLSLYHLRGQAIPAWLDTRRPVVGKWTRWIILLWPPVVFLGWLVADSPSVGQFFLGPINLLVAGLPVLWVYNSARWKLDGISQIRQWRIFGFSLTVTPILVIFIELAALIILGVFGGLWLIFRFSVNPQLERELMYIVNQFAIAGQDMDRILLLLEPYILQPSVIIWALMIFSGVIPLIEELIKPIALWSLASRKISAHEGFVGGLLCGAGFALMENVLYFTTAMVVDDWLFMAIGRAGTGVMHMLASGLVGWGLARAWEDGKWQFLGLTSIGAILLHGLWNALALMVGIIPLFLVGSEITFWQTLLFNLPILFLLLIAAISLYLINRHLRQGVKIQTKEISNEIGEMEVVAES